MEKAEYAIGDTVYKFGVYFHYNKGFHVIAPHEITEVHTFPEGGYYYDLRLKGRRINLRVDDCWDNSSCKEWLFPTKHKAEKALSAIKKQMKGLRDKEEATS